MSRVDRLKELFKLVRIITRDYHRGMAVRLWFQMFMIMLQSRIPSALRRAQRLDLTFEGKSFSIWMLDRTSLAAFEEIFLRGEYKIDIMSPRVVIDAGANIGVASIYFLLRYPGARLYA